MPSPQIEKSIRGGDRRKRERNINDIRNKKLKKSKNKKQNQKAYSLYDQIK